MSFDYNPFEHIEIIRKASNEFVVHCHSCGGDSPKPSEVGLNADTPIRELFRIAGEHIILSHERTIASFKDWSIY